MVKVALFTKEDQKALRKLEKQIKNGEKAPEELETFLEKSCKEGEERWKRMKFK